MADIENLLEHSGIPNQKWGQRRYQNPDGTYTEEGKIRKRAYYRENYARYSNEQLKTMADRNKAIADYEESVNRYDKAINDRIRSTDKVKSGLEKSSNITDNTNKTMVNVTNILKNAPLLVVAGAAFVKAFSKDGNARESAEYIRDKTVETGKNFFEKLKNFADNFRHSSDTGEFFLAHHGILGQKWGVRRYQNPDGSLTPIGRRRYGVKSYNDLSPSQKRDIAKRDAELKAEDEARNRSKAEEREARRAYRLEKRAIKADERMFAKEQKADIQRQEQERQRQKDEIVQKEFSKLKKGFLIGGTILTIAGTMFLYKKYGDSEKVKEAVKDTAEKTKDKVKDSVVHTGQVINERTRDAGRDRVRDMFQDIRDRAVDGDFKVSGANLPVVYIGEMVKRG